MHNVKFCKLKKTTTYNCYNSYTKEIIRKHWGRGGLSTNVHSQFIGKNRYICICSYKVPKLHCAKEVSTVYSHPSTENKLPRQYVLSHNNAEPLLTKEKKNPLHSNKNQVTRTEAKQSVRLGLGKIHPLFRLTMNVRKKQVNHIRHA